MFTVKVLVTFLSKHDPVSLAASVPGLERQVVEGEFEPGGRSVDLKTTQTVSVYRVDVWVVWTDEVT